MYGNQFYDDDDAAGMFSEDKRFVTAICPSVCNVSYFVHFHMTPFQLIGTCLHVLHNAFWGFRIFIH